MSADSLTTAEAAALLGLARAESVAGLLNRGVLKGEKRGRDWLVPREEVDRYAATRRPAHRPRRERGEEQDNG